MARRQHLTLILACAIAGLVTLSWLMSAGSSTDYVPAQIPKMGGEKPAAAAATEKPAAAEPSKAHQVEMALPSSILTGGSIAPKLENKTAKAELGRASWKLFHTMMARFPEKPSEDDSLALKTYIQLFARLYPCGDCASHFQGLLKKYPPQTSSRNAAAGWACFVHNQVNKRLEKPDFDCNNIGDFYDCGCGDEDKKKKEGGQAADTREASPEKKEKEKEET